ncbi:MAG: response regulator [Proteobacteria bacterium]|nr:response regulator [Pseudomonadota bacterium]
MKVLVVDDSKMLRKILSSELEEAGYEVYEAEDGVDALEKASSVRPHLITMDVDMPRMDGYETVYKIRTELKLMTPEGDKEVPIIFVTSNDTMEGRKRGFQVGAADFIIKPFLKGEVANAVSNLLYPDSALRGMTALIVEDSELTRCILDNILESEGVHTLQAANGLEALEVLKKHEDDIDLVMTDFMMPEMNGDELCRIIRFEMGNKALPVIFLSAMSETASVLKMFKAGASDYIVKPFAKEELLARAKVHLEGRQLNKKLLDQVIELKRLNKLKDDILSVTSHDLRSPLAGILGFTDLLMEDKRTLDVHQEYLTHIKDSGEFLLTLIADILELGRAQSENNELVLKTIPINELVESSVNTVRHMAIPKQIDIKIENNNEDEPYILGDKNALIRIFNNLLSNAIKFTPKEGKVSMVLEEEDKENLKISIIDTGIGIPKDVMPVLFEKFSKASRAGTAGERSTGLGLSITKELIEQHNGSISVSSEEGRGSCFTISLPLIQKEESSPAMEHYDAPIDPVKAPIKSIRIMVVDDNTTTAKLAKTALTKRGYEIDILENGKQALDAYILSLQEESQKFHIIFMDLRMPVMDGFEATTEIRKFEKKHKLEPIPIVAMTAGTEDLWKEKCTKAGLNGVLLKPMNLKNIEEMIGRLIHIDKD